MTLFGSVILRRQHRRRGSNRSNFRPNITLFCSHYGAWVAELHTFGGMKDFLRNSEHLLRVVLLLILGVAAFLLIRQAIIPPEFGKYGHFRPAALDDIRARQIKFAG